MISKLLDRLWCQPGALQVGNSNESWVGEVEFVVCASYLEMLLKQISLALLEPRLSFGSSEQSVDDCTGLISVIT